MKIKAGQFYRARNNAVYYVIGQAPSGLRLDYPFWAVRMDFQGDFSDRTESYRPDGSYSLEPNGKDLVRLAEPGLIETLLDYKRMDAEFGALADQLCNLYGDIEENA